MNNITDKEALQAVKTIQDYLDVPRGCEDCLLGKGNGGCRINSCDNLMVDLNLPPLPTDTAKSDAGKAQLSLVPPQIIYDIARIREYGTAQYGDPENWRTVEPQRYIDACYRHWLAFVKDPHSLDSESSMPHLWHCGCNMAFLCEIYKTEFKG